MTTALDVFPALVGWHGTTENDGTTFTGMVVGLSEDEDTNRTIEMFQSILKKAYADWKSVDITVVPLPDKDYDTIVLEIHGIISNLEAGTYVYPDQFNITAGDLFF